MPQWSRILIPKNMNPHFAPILSEPTMFYAAPPVDTPLLPADIPRRCGFTIVRPVRRHISTSPCAVFPGLNPRLLKTCSGPFPAQHRRAVWHQILPEFWPHRRHLHLLCLVLDHVASCDICHHVIAFFFFFFYPAHRSMLGRMVLCVNVLGSSLFSKRERKCPKTWIHLFMAI